MKLAAAVAKELSNALLSLAISGFVLYLLWRSSAHTYADFEMDFQGVKRLLATTLPALSRSAILIFFSILISLTITLILTAFRYRFRYLSALRRSISASTYFFSAIPVAFGGYYLISAFKSRGVSLIHPSTFSDSPEWLYYLVPALTLAVGDGFLSEIFRHTEEEVISVSGGHHLLMAKSRGEKVGKDVVKEVSLRVFRVFSSRIVSLFSGSVVVEFMFKLPGAGSLAFDAAETRNLPILIGLIWSVVVISIFSNFLHFLIVLTLDPRQR